MSELDDGRRADLVGALGAVRSRISDACAAAGRDVRTVTLIAVTKTYPATDVATLARLGLLDVGESRDQEAAAKVDETAQLLAQLPDTSAPRWHFVGQLQRRKSRSVAGYAHAVHSVDRTELVQALSAAVEQIDRAPLEVFLQLSVDGDPDRGGALAADIPALADAVAAADRLRLRGLMAVAPMDADPDEAFAVVEQASSRLRGDHPGADAISAGMSGDLEQAVRHGATHVRVGTALLGRRAPVFG
ncbi:MAG TPA: YggS family pyridoxal phosphate-dependent enzyme [Jatrophihabitantaceae bacterium]